jgi:hypothetical protein
VVIFIRLRTNTTVRKDELDCQSLAFGFCRTSPAPTVVAIIAFDDHHRVCFANSCSLQSESYISEALDFTDDLTLNDETEAARINVGGRCLQQTT